MEWIHNWILQLLGSATKVIIIIMFLLISVNSESSCNSKPVKAKTIYNENAHAYLAVRNGTVATIDKQHILYTITTYMDKFDEQRDHRKSSKFFIFDPSANKFICYMKKRQRFVSKKVPRPEDSCLFIEEPSNYQIKYLVEYERNKYSSLKFGKNGKQITRPNNKPNRSESFLSMLNDAGCRNAMSNFCSNLSKKRHFKTQTIRKICSRN